MIQLPTPKYKIGDTVWVIRCDSIEEVTIDCVIVKGKWFDNGYTSRNEFKVYYEFLSYAFDSLEESEFYGSKRTAQRKLQKQRTQRRQEGLERLKEDVKTVKHRCSLYGLTIDDL